MHALHFSLKNVVWRLVSAVAVGFIFRVDATVGAEFACPGLLDRLLYNRYKEAAVSTCSPLLPIQTRSKYNFLLGSVPLMCLQLESLA